MCKWGPSGVRVVGETDHKAGTRSPRLVVLCEKLMTKLIELYPKAQKKDFPSSDKKILSLAVEGARWATDII